MVHDKVEKIMHGVVMQTPSYMEYAKLLMQPNDNMHAAHVEKKT